MQRQKRAGCHKCSGAVLIISMVMVAIFSAVALGMIKLSNNSVQISYNQHRVNSAFCSAQSGLEVIRHYLNAINVAGDVTASGRLEAVAGEFQSNLNDASIYNIDISYDSAGNVLTLSPVFLDSQTGEDFSAVLSQPGDDSLSIEITGRSSGIVRKITGRFDFVPVGHSVFDYGLASKGPLSMTGNVDIEGMNHDVEASVYIESYNDILALTLNGKSAIAGEVGIVNQLATVDIGNASSISGASGDDAEQYVHIGVPPADFPNPNPAKFESYVETIFDPNTDTTTNMTLTNVRIPANSNPIFSGNVIIEGICFVDTPNVIKFSGNTDITGIIVGNGSLDTESPQNRLELTGSVESHSISELSDDFEALKEEGGTFVLAPGFELCFSGDFTTLNGAIAGNGITFSGNAGGTINGSVINYSDVSMTMSGNTNLVFNRSGSDTNPSGFGPSMTLRFCTDSYGESAI